jgi:hypothetical protein
VFRDNLENIQGTSRDHSGTIQGTFRGHPGNIQGTFREPVRDYNPRLKGNVVI